MSNSGDGNSHNQDTIPTQEMDRLLKELEASTFPLAKAVRKRLQGREADFSSARVAALKAIDAIVEQVSPSAKPRGPQSYTPADLMATYWQRMNERRAYATTGFESLNKKLSGGFDQETLVVLMGAPGGGKTTFANQVGDHVAFRKRPVLYVTSEDTPHRLLSKTIARRGKIEYGAVLRGLPDKREQITQVMQAYQQTDNACYLRYVDATQGVNLDTVYELAVQHFDSLKETASGAPLLVVDYLQRLARFESLGQDLRHSITVYTERLRALACDLKCTVLVLCAMNRQSGYSAGNSTIASAKESGDIDYTADVIMAIGAQEDESETIPGFRPWMLRIDKNRQGDVTFDGHHIYLDWYASCQQFTEREKTQGNTTSTAGSAGNGRYSRRGR